MPKNTLSVEVGLTTFTHGRPGQYSFADTLLRLGVITDVAEVRFAWLGELYDDQASGTGDASRGTKIKVLRQDTALAERTHFTGPQARLPMFTDPSPGWERGGAQWWRAG